jgi:hypothetical protein
MQALFLPATQREELRERKGVSHYHLLGDGGGGGGVTRAFFSNEMNMVFSILFLMVVLVQQLRKKPTKMETII